MTKHGVLGNGVRVSARSAAIALGISALAVAACGSSGSSNLFGAGTDGGDEAGTCTPDLPTIQSRVLVPTCAGGGCHNATDRAADLDVTVSDLAKRLVGVTSGTCDGWSRVVPGSPDKSLLYEKVAATPACGDHMPLGGKDLSASDKDCIRAWIAGLPPLADAGTLDASCGDTQSSALNCGTCGNACVTGSSCVAGKCQCTSPLVLCGSSCVDVQSDAKDCGGCNQPCGTGTVCYLGKCSMGCGNLKQCGQSCVDTATSLSNCSDCGKVCAAGTTCSASKCVCANGGALCGGTCVLTDSDTANCGACGRVCAPGQTCTGGTCKCGTASVSFSGAVQPIFTASCAVAGCHAGVLPKESLKLSAGSAYAGLVGVTAKECSDGRLRVKQGDPATSYLVQKLTNVSLCSGSQMPKAGSSLSSAELQTITNWICAGAPNN